MRRALLPAFAVTLALAALGACQSGIPRHESQADIRARYVSYAGAPLDRMTFLGHFYSWESLGDNQLVVYTTPSDAFLMTVTPPCTDLPWAQTIGLTSTAGTVYPRLDSVTVKGWRCPIAQIQRIDYARMRADMRAEAEKAKAQAAAPQ
ncbi:MAG: hypothetical protein JSS29_15475 [Proteobacteria bacterium]|nr:hypothetical protein [Pseudomonadota bacterium]